ncbi:hypothetical protein EON65_04510 [archaeon]|nr:MAG: hypothetical protein EON65_04510 [archaeon]
MGRSTPQENKPAYSRNIMHSNLANKAGFTYQKNSGLDSRYMSKGDKSKAFRSFAPHHADHERIFEDHMILKGRPPKQNTSHPMEYRFVIPCCFGCNKNIFEQCFNRAHNTYDLCMHDLRSQFKIKAFATDSERVEVIDA